MSLRIFIGWDPRDALAAEVCASSLRRLGHEPEFLRRDELVRSGVHRRDIFRTFDGQLYDVPSRKPMSTEFAFTRFHVPEICNYRGWALFTDPDTLWTHSPADLEFSDNFAVWCVHHDHRPSETHKMGGLIQTAYPRKNWSSVMLFNCEHDNCRRIRVNGADGLDLHGFGWLGDEQPGELAEHWNWLALPGRDKYDAPERTPACIHWTLGGPWMRGYGNTPYADLWRAEAADYFWQGRVRA